LARRRSARSVRKPEKVEWDIISETGFHIIGGDIRILDARDLIPCFSFLMISNIYVACLVFYLAL
jgi:hypothetical protein